MLNKILDYSIISKDIRILEETSDYYTLKLRRSSHKHVRIPKKITKEIAYLFGAIMGDGSLTLAKRKESSYPMTKLEIFNNSKEYLTKLNKILYKYFRVPTIIYKKKDCDCFSLYLANKFVWLYFSKNLNIKNKKLNLKIPKKVNNKKLFRYFLAGLFDTDGYYSKTYGMMLGGTQYNLLNNIKKSSLEYHKIVFLGPKMNTLKVKEKIYYRCYMNTSRYSNSRFRKSIPLIHEKYL